MKSHDVNSERAYNFIRKRILSGEYRPGQHLTAKVLSEEIELSPTPVREALRQLEADGLVTIQPRMGAKVNVMSLKDFRELCELRLVLESYVAGLTAERRSPAELLEIELALGEMRRVGDTIQAGSDEEEARLLTELMRMDIQFHLAIMAAAKNDLIRDEILRLHLINRVVTGALRSVAGEVAGKPRAERHAHMRQVLADHVAIFESIKVQDAAAARSAMGRSIQDVINQTILARTREERDLLAQELTSDEAPGALRDQSPNRTSGRSIAGKRR